MPLPDPTAPPGSLWELKPWWCQPWSILLTGMALIIAIWRTLQLWWLTAGVIVVIGAWWLVFLVLMPAAWKVAQSGPGGTGSGDTASTALTSRE